MVEALELALLERDERDLGALLRDGLQRLYQLDLLDPVGLGRAPVVGGAAILCAALLAGAVGVAQGKKGGKDGPPVMAKQAQNIPPPVRGPRAKNITLLVGDGMEVTHIDAVRARYYGAGGRLPHGADGRPRRREHVRRRGGLDQAEPRHGLRVRRHGVVLGDQDLLALELRVDFYDANGKLVASGTKNYTGEREPIAARALRFTIPAARPARTAVAAVFSIPQFVNEIEPSRRKAPTTSFPTAVDSRPV